MSFFFTRLPHPREPAAEELNGILEKQPGPEVLEQLEQYQDRYNWGDLLRSGDWST